MKYLINSEDLGTVKIYKDEVSENVFNEYKTMFNSKENAEYVEFTTINLENAQEQESEDDEEANEELENAYYENKKMGDFLEMLGFTPDEITSFIINGSKKDVKKMISRIKG